MECRLEFQVDASSSEEWKEIETNLKNNLGISSVTVDEAAHTLILKTALPSAIVHNCLEQSGKNAILKGLGSKQNMSECSVSQLSGDYDVMGVVRFVQMEPSVCLIDGVIDGLSPGLHGLHVHECGDLSRGCDRIGGHFNPQKMSHGSPNDYVRHAGDLGNIIADDKGRATFHFCDSILKVSEIIGRSLAVKAGEDDCGKGELPTSAVDGNSGKILACGVIARSAGLFQNPKKICLCSGKTLWDERVDAKQLQEKTY